MESLWTNLEITEDPNMMLHFQMKFSLSMLSSLVKEGRPGTSHLLSAELFFLLTSRTAADSARSSFRERDLSESWPGYETTNGHSLVSLKDKANSDIWGRVPKTTSLYQCK